MEATNIVRRLDELNKVVIPKEFCEQLNIQSGDPIEFYKDDNSIIIRKYQSSLETEIYELAYKAILVIDNKTNDKNALKEVRKILKLIIKKVYHT